MFFGILIFEPNYGFCMGPCIIGHDALASMMADFQNALIFRIFSVLWSGFLQKTTLNDL